MKHGGSRRVSLWTYRVVKRADEAETNIPVKEFREEPNEVHSLEDVRMIKGELIIE